MKPPERLSLAPVDVQTAVELWKWCYENVPTEAGGNIERTIQHRIGDTEELFDFVWSKFSPVIQTKTG